MFLAFCFDLFSNCMCYFKIVTFKIGSNLVLVLFRCLFVFVSGSAFEPHWNCLFYVSVSQEHSTMML